MQFPTFITGTIILLLASSATAQSGKRAGRLAIYVSSSSGTACQAGVCGGNNGICPKGTTQSVDSPSQRDNMAACAGKPAKAALLLRLRQKEKKRSIWIDQLCIDQSNLVEEAIQAVKDAFALSLYKQEHGSGPRRNYMDAGIGGTQLKELVDKVHAGSITLWPITLNAKVKVAKEKPFYPQDCWMSDPRWNAESENMGYVS
ncbi:hypothetical protein VTL71DRAFT_2450 [Oculimacula yallundae]|uniref:Heterokaryon incompatibility domain-containing protein n=1 Tax=Oculimacula yallundae TaxID=86028 RepID=A0ABR4CAX4_9HELO